MSLKIYNTFTGKKEEFKPIKQGEAGMYVCGVTLYDRCHLGHARAGVVFDFVFRSLSYLGYKATYVRNFTDVDDKIINRANQRGISTGELVEENLKLFYEDMDALFLKRPTFEPRATKYIDAMQKMIAKLIDKGLAYQVGGDVFYSVSSFREYGKLSKKNTNDLMEGARVEVNEAKRNPLDFALWKDAKPGEPKWDSPWGEGRPGWHIECSAMGREILGETFDIHGGGRDLIFPHHENEIAQSHGASGKPPVNFWMHNGFVNINKEKMSKSLGNFFTIKDVLEKFDPEAVRLYLLSTHYRSPIDFADSYLKEAETHLNRLYMAAVRAEKVLDGKVGEMPEKTRSAFITALEDDFNSAAALAVLNDAANGVNVLCDSLEKNRDEKKISELADLYAGFKEIGGVLGILNRKPADYMANIKAKRLSESGMTGAEIEELIEKRTAARKAKNFAEADQIRDALAEKGIELMDSPGGTTWTAKIL
ncbi:MAG: cysteine--tRNA ligase [bacterium]|nr:MAG: cysteine--tRNA ligase [bacterium]